MSGFTLAPPVCWRCARTVEHFSMERDPERSCYVVTVHCHGKQETTILSDETVQDAITIEAGFAFKPDNVTAEAVQGLLERIVR